MDNNPVKVLNSGSHFHVLHGKPHAAHFVQMRCLEQLRLPKMQIEVIDIRANRIFVSSPAKTRLRKIKQ